MKKTSGVPKGYKFNQGVVFENEEYKITIIPENYQIECKLMKPGEGKNQGKLVRLISAPFYSYLGWGLEYAKKTAEMMVNKYKNALSLQ